MKGRERAEGKVWFDDCVHHLRGQVLLQMSWSICNKNSIMLIVDVFRVIYNKS